MIIYKDAYLVNIFIWIGEFFLWERLSSFVLIILVRD